jgi:hypothetical protein
MSDKVLNTLIVAVVGMIVGVVCLGAALLILSQGESSGRDIVRSAATRTPLSPIASGAPRPSNIPNTAKYDPQAIAYYKPAIKPTATPDREKLAGLWLKRGNDAYEAKKYRTAIRNYSKAIQYNPKFAQAYYNRGLACYKLRQYPQAKADMNKAKAQGYERPIILFYADRTIVNQGQCTLLRWDVENVRKVYLDGEGVVGHDTRKVCPGATKTYTLHVVLKDGSTTDRPLRINVPRSAKINRVSRDFNDKEMVIKTDFTIRNCKGEKGTVAALFYRANGAPLKDNDGINSTKDGNVVVWEDFKPRYTSSTYGDFWLFMPYNQLHLPRGEHSLKFRVVINCPQGNRVARSNWVPFTYTR